VEHINGLPVSDRVAAFFRLWTIKEAYLKARGLGIGGLDAAEVMEEMYSGKYALAEVLLPPGYRGAVALAGKLPGAHCFKIQKAL
jgi:4'-phosphopantetheinyl transferase